MEKALKNSSSDLEKYLIPIIPAVNVLIFPNMIVPLLVLDEKVIGGVLQAANSDKKILVLSTKEELTAQDEIGINDLNLVGTVASIMRIINMPEGGIKVLLQGLFTANVNFIENKNNILIASVEKIKFNNTINDSCEVIIKNIKNIAQKLSFLSHNLNSDFYTILSKIQNPEQIIEFILTNIEIKPAIAQSILEKRDIESVLNIIYYELHKEVVLVETQEKIRLETQESINKTQNEYYLREQLKIIKKELGEDHLEELEEFKRQIEAKDIPKNIKKDLLKQVNKLERTSAESIEANVHRNYLEYVLSLPWGIYTTDNLNITHASEVLDSDHYGLNDIKERILDFISVRNLNATGKAPILCFSGPPGVGKTSLGKSIAKALGRNFYRISLGGIKDEAEIRGHRKTYVGAMPGRIIQAMKKSKSMNPVILIDELDKISADFKGDPAAALLEVLDLEQNNEFYDNYLGLPFDLSKVLFIATANYVNNISAPLRDRLEVIDISGYTLEEKENIAARYLIKEALLLTGLNSEDFEIGSEVLKKIIYSYTKESGVRSLNKILIKLCSKVARSIVEKKEKIIITTENINKYLGSELFIDDSIETRDMIGITNGLAWTPYGGEVLQIEAMCMKGSGKLILTGQLGDVMKESAQAALSYARSNAGDFGIEVAKFVDYDIHIHVPAGAVPKDGPSAGITILVSILSVLTSKPINSKFAMTGELNLRGDIMPIGGVKEKLLAAKRHKLENIILPEKNKNELEKIKDLINDIKIIWVKNAKEVLSQVLININ